MHEHDHHAHAHAHTGRAAHGDAHARARTNRRRLLVVAFSGALVALIEVAGGIAANSLVLVADAAHYATDVAAVLIAVAAVSLSMRAPTSEKTFGYKRAEVLAAFVNAAALWGLSAYFLYESYRRIVDPPPVSGTLVMLVGGFTLVANVVLAWTLRERGEHNINMHAAYLHILSDVLGSAAALLAGVAVALFGWHVADPILTVFVTLLILAFTWRLTRDTLHILLEGAPRRIDMNEVSAAIMGIAAVKDVHELHVWSLSSGTDILSVHVVLQEPPKGDAVTHDIHETLRKRFSIDHVTVQVESPECPCEMARC